MKKKKNTEAIDIEPPQKSLERIIKTEMQVAQEISSAKEKAELAINTARDEVGNIKESILKNAREERDRMLADGIDEANKKAQKDIKRAEQSSTHFFEKGRKFITDAVEDVIHIVLDDKDGSK